MARQGLISLNARTIPITTGLARKSELMFMVGSARYPELAVQLVTEDAKLSHQGAGIAGAQVVAAWGSRIPSHTRR